MIKKKRILLTSILYEHRYKYPPQLVNQIQEYGKRIIHHDQVKLGSEKAV